MSTGRFDPLHSRQSRKESPRDRLEQSKTARKVQLDQLAQVAADRAAKLRAEEEAKRSRPVRDLSIYRKALLAMPLLLAGETQARAVSDLYAQLVDVALRCMNNQSREAVLCWPGGDPSPSAIATFIALASAGATSAIKHDGLDALAPPLGLRALVYPYARTAHRALRHIYADKDYLARLHTIHQIRANRREEDQGLADYHKTLARVKTLTGVALDGKTYDEFRHPCLDETLPSGPCLGTDGRSELLWRVRTKTDLRKISRTGKADNPASAQFYLFGLRASDQIASSLKALGGKLDIVFLDLTRTSRNRLGRDWLARVRSFLDQLEQHLGQVATVALTDDPWTFDSLRFEGLVGVRRRKVRNPPAPHSVVFAPTADLAAPYERKQCSYSPITKQDVVGFSGEVETLLRGIRSSTRAASALNDLSAVEMLQRLSGTIRRCASLPGSREQLVAYVEGEIGGLAAADLLASYRVGSVLKELRASLGSWAQHSRSDIVDLCADVDRVWDNTARLTPMAPLLRDVVQRFLRVSSRTAILFRNDMLADFAAHALGQDSEIGRSVNERIENDMLVFLDLGGLDDLEQLPATKRNYVKTLVVVAPTRGQILSLLARPWLPAHLVVLADSDTLASSARDAERLGSYAELSVLATRMTAFAQQAAKTVHHHAYTPNQVDPNAEPSEDVEFPASSVVNLAGNVRPDQPTIQFTLSGQQIVVARPGTKLILHDRTRTVPTFIECLAKDVDIGDRVCVIGDAFLEMARPLLNITARAAEEIRDYHHRVLKGLDRIPGVSSHEKLIHIVQAMALPDVSVQRADYWIDLHSQLDVPLHEVVPHAPRDRHTFLAFMKAIGVSETVALHFWTWAVIAQRTSRVRAAMHFHDAYRTILIDTYAAQSSNPERVRDIRRLKAAAEDFVGIVEHKKEQRGERDRA